MDFQGVPGYGILRLLSISTSILVGWLRKLTVHGAFFSQFSVISVRAVQIDVVYQLENHHLG